MTGKLLVLALVSTLLVPVAMAQTYSFGTSAGKGDHDYFPNAKVFTGGGVTLCFVDDDADGMVDRSEAVFLLLKTAVCRATAGKDIRLTESAGKSPGTEIKSSGDADYGIMTIATADHAVRWVEYDGGDATFKPKDIAYIDLQNIPSLTVNIGDLRLSAFEDLPAGSWVKEGDRDATWALAEFGGVQTHVEDADVIYQAGNGVYLNVDKGVIGAADLAVEEGDVRLLAKVTNPLAPSAQPPADIVVTGIALDPVTASPLDPVRALVTVENQGKGAGSALIETSLDGLVVDGRGSPWIEPGKAAVLTVRLQAPETIGEHIVATGAAQAALQVVAAADAAVASVETLQTAAAETHERLDVAEREKAQLEATVLILQARLDDLESLVAKSADPSAPDAAAADVQTASAPGFGAALVALSLVGAVLLAARKNGR